MNNRNLCLTVLEAGRSEIKALVDSLSGEGYLPVHRHLAVSSLTAVVARGLSGVSLIRELIPFMRVYPYNLITYQRPHLLTPPTPHFLRPHVD